MVGEIEQLHKLVAEGEALLVAIRSEEVKEKLKEAIDLAKKGNVLKEIVEILGIEEKEVKTIYSKVKEKIGQHLKKLIEELYNIRKRERERVIEIYNSERVKVFIKFEELYEDEDFERFKELLNTFIVRYYSETNVMNIDFIKLVKDLLGENILGHDINDCELSYRIYIIYKSYKLEIIAQAIRNSKVIKVEYMYHRIYEYELNKEEYEIYKKVKDIVTNILKIDRVENTINTIFDAEKAINIIKELKPLFIIEFP